MIRDAKAWGLWILVPSGEDRVTLTHVGDDDVITEQQLYFDCKRVKKMCNAGDTKGVYLLYDENQLGCVTLGERSLKKVPSTQRGRRNTHFLACGKASVWLWDDTPAALRDSLGIFE